ncbi:hypothetical protein K0M31_006368 [Melipona bicolor]|uniref:Uncharacterized protein n=1 Tax=Melipona bicolor TaxID=60889 RepID=A0AA40FU45_9HYME|nr:hypothetical protein K0M31_006368 [Melipona bicolor]
MPSINELKELIDVEDDLQHQKTSSESVNDYLHSKIPCSIKFDATKNQYYNNTVNAMSSENTNLDNYFTFTETLPNGKLAIPVDSDTESEENSSFNNLDQGTLLENKLRDKYNVHLSIAEKESIHKSSRMKKLYSKKYKSQLQRNAKGQFIKSSGVPIKIEKDESEFDAAENINFYDSIDANVVNEPRIWIENNEENQFILPDINLSDINPNDIDLSDTNFDINDIFNFSDISCFSQNNSTLASVANKEKTEVKKGNQFFKPFKQYWMYDCIFSRVKPKNFAIFEKSLPRSFRWLLNECALIVEMTTEDLYEEVCLIENYYAHVLKFDPSNDDDRTEINSIPKSQLNFILNKW